MDKLKLLYKMCHRGIEMDTGSAMLCVSNTTVIFSPPLLRLIRTLKVKCYL